MDIKKDYLQYRLLIVLHFLSERFVSCLKSYNTCET